MKIKQKRKVPFIVRSFISSNDFKDLYELKDGFCRFYYIDIDDDDRYDISLMWDDTIYEFSNQKL